MTLNDRALSWVKERNWKAKWAAGGTVAAVVGAGLIALDSPHGPRDCEQVPLRHVYAPKRLTVLETCKTVTVTVIAWRHEQDDDWHVNVRPDDGTLVNGQNIARQHGLLVLEWIPRDPRPAKFFCGQRLEVTGTYVLDRQHGGWSEIHPVFSWRELERGACTRVTVKSRGKLAPPTE